MVVKPPPGMIKGVHICLTLIAISASAFGNVRFSPKSYTPCHKTVLSDPRCFKVIEHQTVYVMQCGPGTYFNNRTCSCDLYTSNLPHHLAPVNCQQLYKAITSSAHPDHQSMLSCTSGAYTHLERVKTQHHCVTSDSMWSRLQFVKTHDSIDCMKKIISEMNDYYGSWNVQNGHSPCTCNGVKTFIKWPTEDTSRCYYHDSNFNHMYRTVFGSRDTHNTNTYGRRCASHNTMWSYLDAVSKAHTSTDCLELLVQIMTEAYHNIGANESCSCQENDHHVATTTTLPALHNNDYCRHYSSYQDIHNLIHHDQCLSDQTAFQKLSALVYSGSRTRTCAEHLVSDMYVVFGKMAQTPSNCSCSAATHLSHFDPLGTCVHIPIYEEITSKYVYSSHHYPTQHGHTTAPCNTHHSIWSSLYSLLRTDSTCLHDAILKIASRSHTEACSCHTATSTPAPHHSHSVNCHEYSGYKELMAVLSTDMCVSYTKVWGPLKILGSQRQSCLVEAIKEMAGRFNHFDRKTCSCSHNGTYDLVFRNVHGGHYQDCKDNFRSTYTALLTNVLGHHPTTTGSQGQCMTHQTVWAQLHLLAGTTSRTYCLMDLINHLALSTHSHTDTCACHPVHVTVPTTPRPVTIHPTSHPTTTQAAVTVNSCQKLETLIALAHNSYLVDNAAPCPSGGHSKAEATVVDLCSAPASISWHKGYNVLDHCKDIPQYSAIAAFAGNIYLGDGLAGIFISCNTTTIKIATQRCDHPMEVLTVVRGSRDQYTHMAENYYTIQW
ncbi:uncharacterized protein LOC117317927 isoform X2 [Pecten maximus]|uniref:uncharacterized protein LOC117317927 isoform X2 n=1 Tax=Pecten maximus TaxID=6579 RepID=UPI0014587F10|nr:uncharacterized protein LOC117317927 isoform X2 [Pecten maximus]